MGENDSMSREHGFAGAPSEKESDTLGKAGKPRIGGWLFLLGLGLFFSVVAKAFVLFATWNTRRSIKDEVLGAVSGLLAFELAGAVIALLLACILVIQFIRKKRSFVILYLFSAVAIFLFILVDFLWLNSLIFLMPADLYRLLAGLSFQLIASGV